MAIITFTGWHGTDYANTSNIKDEGFKISKGDEHYLGDGAYYFIKGISQQPDKNAESWAIAEAWDKTRNRLKYHRYSIFSSEIEVEEESLLDLSTYDGMHLFNYLRTQFIEKIISENLFFSYKDYLDGMMLNWARNELLYELDVVIGDFYFKFAKERMHFIQFRQNNVTICTVFDPAKNIKKTTLQKTGYIDYATR